MRRTIPWAVAALLPIAGAIVIVAAPDDSARTPAPIPEIPFFVAHWFELLVILLLAQVLFFAVHAWRNPKVGPNRRLFWVVAIVSFAFVATPLYWWAYSDTAT
jgi:hypothetical protein